MTTAPAPRPGTRASAKPPRWLPRALALAVVAAFVGIFAWRALGSLSGLIVNLVIALFFALAMEPMILWLVRHGWKRGAATGTVMFGVLSAVGVVLTLFGTLFAEQAAQLITTLPDTYASVAGWTEDQFAVKLPEMRELQSQLINEWGEEVATRAIAIGSSVLGGVFAFTTILLVAYYLAAAGPKFRASICGWLSPRNQTEVLRLWEVSQLKISDYLNSRIILAVVASVFTGVFLTIVDIPYALPLALFTGVVSQFVPTIGTYIGGALPVIFALTTDGPQKALLVVAFIVLYQQVENFWLAPKVSARALQMNPAVSFVVVLAFGAVFGALGAFLALPIAATVQAVASTYLRRHELIDSHMLRDPAKSDGWSEVDDTRAPADGPTDGEPAPPSDGDQSSIS
ncbi:AI-2E family transporter [Sanguibacter sp. 25GB23B1]|uniref:AI-2E family transporter n=1 Tax=unclassified Sanguibacter TaxID=2645534 RepID=UPI0032AEC0D4